MYKFCLYVKGDFILFIRIQIVFRIVSYLFYLSYFYLVTCFYFVLFIVPLVFTFILIFFWARGLYILSPTLPNSGPFLKPKFWTTRPSPKPNKTLQQAQYTGAQHQFAQSPKGPMAFPARPRLAFSHAPMQPLERPSLHAPSTCTLALPLMSPSSSLLQFCTSHQPAISHAPGQLWTGRHRLQHVSSLPHA